MALNRQAPISETSNSLPTALIIGSDFIGLLLAEKLLDLNLKVLWWDILADKDQTNSSKCLQNPNFTVINRETHKPDKNFNVKIDYVFYLPLASGNKETQASPEEMNYWLNLAVKNKAKFLLASILEDKIKNNLPELFIQNKSLDLRTVFLKDIFGPGMDLTAGNYWSEFFSDLIFHQELKIPGDGLMVVYPTFISDVINGLVRAMFKSQTRDKIFHLFGPKISLLNFSFLLKKDNPVFKIIYIKAKETFSLPDNDDLYKDAGEISCSNRPLEQTVKETIRSYQGMIKDYSQPVLPPTEIKTIKAPVILNKEKTVNNPAIDERKDLVKKTEKVSPVPRRLFFSFLKFPKILKKKKFVIIFLSSLLILLAVFFPVISAAATGFLGFKKLQEIEKKKIIKDLDQTSKIALSASYDFAYAHKQINSLTWLSTIINLRSSQEKYSELTSLAQNLSETIYHAFLAGKEMNNLFGGLTGELSEDLGSRINKARLELDQAKEKLSMVYALLKEMKSKKFEKILFSKRKIDLSVYEEKIKFTNDQINKIDNLLIILPKLLGENERQTYLILLQNNMELRPTGGFIGSFALATLEGGKLIDFKVEDVYTADGQLKGKVKPPDEILHYLGQPNWFLRDSNFSPDFSLSAKRAQFFLEKEMGILTDGVIGVDLSLAQKLIKAVKEIELPDYQEKITAENLFIKAESQAENNFFPGSTQKKNFLSSLGNALFERLKKAAPAEYFSLGSSLIESLNEKHLTFFFNDQKVQDFFQKQNISGEIKNSPTAIDSSNNNDFLMVVDANLGANKANYFLDRKIKQEISINNDNKIIEKVTINFKNRSPTDTWPGGRYKTYLRIYVPQEALCLNSSINENKTPKLIKALTEDELKKLPSDKFLVIEASEAGRKSWGTLVEIPVGKSKEVTFSYQLPAKLEFINGINNYYLYVQKQAGTIKDQYQLVINLPDSLTVIDKSKQGIEKGKSLYYNTDLLEDREFRIKLKK